MKTALAATTYAQRARLDLHTMQLAQGLPDPKTRTTRPPPKPQKEAKDPPAIPGPLTTQEARPHLAPLLLPQNKKSAEPEKVKKRSEIYVLRL
jgi:hypothetical protein